MSRSKYEIYVEALLDYYEELKEKRDLGLWHLADEIQDLEQAIQLAELTPKQREAIQLVFLEQLGQSEAAKRLGIGQPRVSNRVSAAIRKIANIYEQWEALEYAG